MNTAQVIAIAWTLIGALCGFLAPKLKPGLVKNVIVAIAHVSPGNVVGAYKALTSSVLVALVFFLPGCGGDSVDLQSQVAVNAYNAREQACWVLATTYPEAESCFQKVRAEWCSRGAYLYEAGACSYDAGLDGGAQ